MPAAALPDLNALDVDALRTMVVEQHALIERLQTMIAHLRRMQFGRKSEKIERQVEQLELELEELESAKAAQLEELERKLEPAKAVRLKRYASQCAALYLSIFHAMYKRTHPLSSAARRAVRN